MVAMVITPLVLPQAGSAQSVASKAASFIESPRAPASVPEAARSDASSPDAPKPAAGASEFSSAENVRVTASKHPSRRPVSLTVDDRVRLLSRTLDLDPSQQAKLRELLEIQRREIRKLWTNSPPTVSDRVAPTLAILERTKDQIRAMLTEPQKAKYPAAVPHDALAPAQVDAEYWMRLTQPRAGKAAGSAD